MLLPYVILNTSLQFPSYFSRSIPYIVNVTAESIEQISQDHFFTRLNCCYMLVYHSLPHFHIEVKLVC